MLQDTIILLKFLLSVIKLYTIMRIKFLICFLLFSLSVISQEIGSVKNGIHSIKLLKSNNLFSCVYSDVYSVDFNKEKSFNFPNIDTIYTIVMDGFKHHKDHQIIVQTGNDTIVKFEFKMIKGRNMLKIKQNNLESKTFGTSTYFSKKDIGKLFGNP